MIIHHLEDLSADWLTDALHASGALPSSGAVASFTTEPIGTGQMGDSYRVALAYDGDADGAPASVVAKLATEDETSRATGLALRCYEVEVNIYAQLAPRLQIRIPRCHHAEVDPATGWFTLLLEDMSPAVQGDQLAGLTAEQIEEATVALAGLHGPCWEDPELAALDWLNRGTDEANTFTAAMVAALFPGFVERYEDRLTCDELDLAAHLIDRLGPYLLERAGPRTVVHGDYRPDNLLFGGADAPAPLTVVDWQTAIWGMPAADVAYAVALGFADPAERAARERGIVERYHEALLATGVTGYSFAECWDGYRRGSFSGMLMAIAPAMLVVRTERGDEMFMAMLRRAAAQVRDLDAVDLLP